MNHPKHFLQVNVKPIKLPKKLAPINLNDCKPGDTLVSKHGKKFVYLNRNGSLSFPHIIMSENGGLCSRIDDGHVFGKRRLPEDDDIVLVIPRSQIVASLFENL